MKILILGDGLLGTELSNQTGWDYISRKKDKFDITDISTYHLLTKVEFGAIQHCPYDVIINTIAHTDTYSDNKKEHWEVNYKGVSNLVEFCNRWKIKLVHIVTDYIYSNSVSNALETDVPVHCNNWYGYTKLLGDAYVQLKSDNYLLLRGTHKEKPFKYTKAWANQKGNFTYVDENVKIISKLIKSNQVGVFNIGTDLKSMYDLALETNNNILPIDKPSNVPGDLSMNINKLKSIMKKITTKQ